MDFLFLGKGQLSIFVGKNMKNLRDLDQITQYLTSVIPSSVKGLQADIENNFNSSLESGLQKMKLVTREEFDIQASVLLKTREKIDILEKKIIELEDQLNTK